MFRGKVQNSIDGKNRVIIPAKYRDALGKECIVTKGLDDCLEVYPMQAWAEEEARYATLPRTDVEARALLRYRSGNAENCELDKQGRMVIPQFLREEAGIEKDLVTIGDHSTVPAHVRVGRNTAILGETSIEDYEGGVLPSGGAIIKAGEE